MEKFYNEATTNKIAEAIGMPTREDSFLSMYLELRSFSYEEYLHYVLTLGKTWAEELPDVAHCVCRELRKQLTNAKEEMARLYDELEFLWKGDEKLSLLAVAEASAALSAAAEKAEALQNRVISICKDFSNEIWAQFIIKSME